MDELENDSFLNDDIESDEEILSFDQLRQAFAQYSRREKESDVTFARISSTVETDSEESEGKTETDDLPEEMFEENPEESVISANDRTELCPRTILEAMLFVGDRENKPLSPEQASELMRNVSVNEIVSLIHELNEHYVSQNFPYHIIQENDLQGNVGFRMVLRQDLESVRMRFYGRVRETRLSQSAIDVLAIVAYKQPISADDVQKQRKTASSSLLNQLQRRGLLETIRSTESKRPILLYKTTENFLKLFRLSSLSDLPTAEEIDYR